MFNFMFNIFLVNKYQLTKAVAHFFQECFEIPAFCIYMFISTKATSPHKGNLLAERIGNYDTQFLC